MEIENKRIPVPSCHLAECLNTPRYNEDMGALLCLLFRARLFRERGKEGILFPIKNTVVTSAVGNKEPKAPFEIGQAIATN